MINNTFIHKSNTMMKHQHGDLFFKFFYSQIPQNFFATSSLRSSVAKLPTLTGRSPPIPISLSSHVCLPRKGSGGAPRPKALAHPPTSLFRKKLGKNYWGTIHRPPNPLKTLREGANLPSASTGWIGPPFTRESQIRSPACYRRRYPRAMFFVSLCCKKFP